MSFNEKERTVEEIKTTQEILKPKTTLDKLVKTQNNPHLVIILCTVCMCEYLNQRRRIAQSLKEIRKKNISKFININKIS
jgi:hypothetical protein